MCAGFADCKLELTGDHQYQNSLENALPRRGGQRTGKGGEGLTEQQLDHKPELAFALRCCSVMRVVAIVMYHEPNRVASGGKGDGYTSQRVSVAWVV